MSNIHRQDDLRACGATTVVSGQSTVFITGKLVSVEGDKNTDGGGDLIASGSSVTINGKKIIVQGDSASPDNKCPTHHGSHCLPMATSGSSTVQAY